MQPRQAHLAAAAVAAAAVSEAPGKRTSLISGAMEAIVDVFLFQSLAPTVFLQKRQAELGYGPRCSVKAEGSPVTPVCDPRANQALLGQGISET